MHIRSRPQAATNQTLPMTRKRPQRTTYGSHALKQRPDGIRVTSRHCHEYTRPWKGSRAEKRMMQTNKSVIASSQTTGLLKTFSLTNLLESCVMENVIEDQQHCEYVDNRHHEHHYFGTTVIQIDADPPPVFERMFFCIYDYFIGSSSFKSQAPPGAKTESTNSS